MGASPSGAPDHASELEAAAWFFENSADAFLVVEGGRVRSVNPAWVALTGLSSAETRGKTPRELIHPDDWPVIEDAMAALAVGLSHTAEHRLKTSTDKWVWVSARTKRATDGAGLVVIQDITEERAHRAEADAVRRSGEVLRENAGLIVWRFDPERKVYLLGDDMAVPVGARGDGQRETMAAVSALIHPDDAEAMGRAFRRSVANGEPGGTTYRQKRNDGDGWSHCRVAWRGIRPLESGLWLMTGVTQDITELVEARDAALQGQEDARAAAEAKAQFLANMSHEIRTPMNGVLGVLHLLKEEPLSAEGRGLIEEALACGSMLSALLNDVIDFSKVEAGRLELAPAPLNPETALDGVAMLLRPQAEARGLWLKTFVGPGVGWVACDPVRLRQMLFNLIGNAVKFTLDGGVEVRLTATGGGPEKRLRVEVEDTGIGIPEEAQDVIFQRFHQADASTTRRFGGSGLGLSITRRLAELMNGDVGFSSREGQGSTFWFEIAAPAADPDKAVDPDEADTAWLAGMRILIVEDNATNRLIAARMLETLGASVETANDGQQGVEAAARQAFDLVLMDVQMPVMDGVTATRLIRAQTGATAEAPIVAMTANVFAHQQQAYREAGMSGAVSKPLSPAALLAEIARIVGPAEDAAAVETAAAG